MKQAREYPQVKVSKKAEHAIIKGHPWVYFIEITEHSHLKMESWWMLSVRKEVIWEPDLQTKTAKSVFV